MLRASAIVSGSRCTSLLIGRQARRSVRCQRTDEAGTKSKACNYVTPDLTPSSPKLTDPKLTTRAGASSRVVLPNRREALCFGGDEGEHSAGHQPGDAEGEQGGGLAVESQPRDRRGQDASGEP